MHQTVTRACFTHSDRISDITSIQSTFCCGIIRETIRRTPSTEGGQQVTTWLSDVMPTLGDAHRSLAAKAAMYPKGILRSSQGIPLSLDTQRSFTQRHGTSVVQSQCVVIVYSVLVISLRVIREWNPPAASEHRPMSTSYVRRSPTTPPFGPSPPTHGPVPGSRQCLPP
jgi:hypothetical protein